jgi:hypothetical protein
VYFVYIKIFKYFVVFRGFESFVVFASFTTTMRVGAIFFSGYDLGGGVVVGVGFAVFGVFFVVFAEVCFWGIGAANPRGYRKNCKKRIICKTP